MHIRHWVVFVIPQSADLTVTGLRNRLTLNATLVCVVFTDDLRTIITGSLFSATCILLSQFSHLPFLLKLTDIPRGLARGAYVFPPFAFHTYQKPLLLRPPALYVCLLILYAD